LAISQFNKILSLTILALKANALSAGNSSSRALANKDINKNEAQFPAAKIKDDEFFGKVGIYRDNVLVSVPVLEGASKLIVVNVEFQGCADLGVCYPPITKSATLKVVSGNKSLIN
jgi:thiol:disulfide interchange protein